MNANGESLSGAEDFIEAEIEAAQMDSPAAEMQVRAALEKLPGIARLDISHGKISVRYDPTRTSEKHISEAVAGAGHPVEKIEASRDEGHASTSPTTLAAPSDGE